jgi:hypothetical protein
MCALAARAFCLLIVFHFYLVRRSFAALQTRVRQFPIGARNRSPFTVDEISKAMDLACIWYPTEVLCLQRSAAAVCLLKHYGIPAQMVVGVRMMPFKAHAWVEVEGRVANDKPYVKEMYRVLDRC